LVTEAHGVNNLPKVSAQWCPARSQTLDLLIVSPTFFRCATDLYHLSIFIQMLYRLASYFYYVAADKLVNLPTTRNSSGDEIANVNFFYDDIVHVLQNTIDSCIHSATDRRGYVLERNTNAM